MTTATRPRSETAEQILDLAETLIQTRGYCAFSYQDVADALGVTKASIHYHFASKTDLGKAVVERYVQRFGRMLAQIAEDPQISSAHMLDRYFEPFLQLSETADRVCLCGALAGEVLAVPAELRQRVDAFFSAHQAWLAEILRRGVARGEFELRAPAEQMSRVVFGALQGGLIVRRTTGDASQLHDIVTALKAQLTRPAS